MPNTNTVARRVLLLAPPAEPLKHAEAAVSGAAVAVLARTLIDNRNNLLLDCTQGDIPLKAKTSNTYSPTTGQLTPGAGNTISLPGVISLASIEPLFASTTATFTSGATTISVASSTGLLAGQSLIGAGIPQGTLISSITGTAPVLSNATTAIGASEAVTSGIGAAGTTQATATGLGLQYGSFNVSGATAGSAAGVSLAAGTGATAGAITITSTTITAIAVATGGSGYTNGATVVIAGNGSGATATATVVGGVVTAIVVTNVGTGYSGTPTATIYPNSISTGSGSLFTVFNSSGTPINIYGGYLDAINNGAAGAGVTLPPGQTGLFIDEAVNQWAFFVSGRNESINAQSGTTYTLAATDQNALVQITNASGITLTLPNSFPAGFTCNVEQGGAGQITCSAASGGSLVGWKTAGAATGASKTAGEYAIVSLRVTANSTGTAAVWNISGQTA